MFSKCRAFKATVAAVTISILSMSLVHCGPDNRKKRERFKDPKAAPTKPQSPTEPKDSKDPKDPKNQSQVPPTQTPPTGGGSNSGGDEKKVPSASQNPGGSVAGPSQDQTQSSNQSASTSYVPEIQSKLGTAPTVEIIQIPPGTYELESFTFTTSVSQNKSLPSFQIYVEASLSCANKMSVSSCANDLLNINSKLTPSIANPQLANPIHENLILPVSLTFDSLSDRSSKPFKSFQFNGSKYTSLHVAIDSNSLNSEESTPTVKHDETISGDDPLNILNLMTPQNLVPLTNNLYKINKGDSPFYNTIVSIKKLTGNDANSIAITLDLPKKENYQNFFVLVYKPVSSNSAQ